MDASSNFLQHTLNVNTQSVLVFFTIRTPIVRLICIYKSENLISGNFLLCSRLILVMMTVVLHPEYFY